MVAQRAGYQCDRALIAALDAWATEFSGIRPVQMGPVTMKRCLLSQICVYMSLIINSVYRERLSSFCKVAAWPVCGAFNQAWTIRP